MNTIKKNRIAEFAGRTKTTRIGEILSDFRRNDSGVSVIEFAFVAPVIMVAWLGMVTLLDTETNTTKVSRVSAAVADIIAQAPSVDSNYINAAFDAGKAMLGNAASADLKIYVVGVEVLADQSIDVKWKCGRHFGDGELDDAIDDLDLPSQLKQAPGFIVAAYSEYTHTPIYGDLLTGEQTYQYNHYFVPRNSLETLSDGC